MLMVKYEVINEAAEEEDLMDSIDPDDERIPSAPSTFNGEDDDVLQIEGEIIVAEDQQINLETLKNYMDRLNMTQYSHFCINGQKAIDKVKEIVDKAFYNDELLH